MKLFTIRRAIVVFASLALVGALGCTTEVIKEVPVDRVVTQEVIKEVPVEKIVEVEKETVRTVEIEKPVEVIKEVVKEVEVPGKTIVVEKEVVKQVEVPGETVIVEKEVVKTVEVPGETIVVEVDRVAAQTELRIANSADPSFLDIHRGQSGTDIFHGRMIFETMLFFDPTMMNPDPGLARSWSVSPDGLTYDLNLRDGVQYHDGSSFNSADAIWNYDRCIIELKEKSRCGNELQNVMSYTALDDYTIRMELGQFSVVFPTQLATTPGFMLQSNVVSGDVDTNPIGTDIAVALVALGVAAGVVFGMDVPFVGAVLGNLIDLIDTLGNNGVVGIIVLAILSGMYGRSGM